MAHVDMRYQKLQLITERTSVETFYRAFTKGEPDLVDEVLSSDWKDIPLAPGQPDGPEGIKPIILSIKDAFPDFEVTIHDVLHTPGRMAVRAEFHGTHLGALFGVEATGKKVSFRSHEFHEFTAGKISKTWHMEDWFGAFMQIGQFPAIA